MRRGKLGPLAALLVDLLVPRDGLGSISLKSLQLAESGKILPALLGPGTRVQTLLMNVSRLHSSASPSPSKNRSATPSRTSQKSEKLLSSGR